jgi:hypothetical protein
MPFSELESLVVLAGLIVGTTAYSLLIRRRMHARRRIDNRLRQLEGVLRVWWASRDAARRAPTVRSRVQVAR